MAYYVSVVNTNGRDKILALGPFNRHGDALREVDRVREHVGETYRDAHWFSYGTAHNKTARPEGKLNKALGFAS